MSSTYTFGWATEGTAIFSYFPSSIKVKKFLITGPSAGSIGAEIAFSLAHGSPHVLLLLGHDLPKIQPTIDFIATISPFSITKFVSISLNALASVHEAAKSILEDERACGVSMSASTMQA